MNTALRQTLALPAPACTPDRELLAAIMRSFDGPGPAVFRAARPAGTAGNAKLKIKNRK